MVSINLVKIEFLNAFLNKWFKIAEQRYNGWTKLQCSLMLHFICITPQVHRTMYIVHCTPYIVIKVDGFDLRSFNYFEWKIAKQQKRPTPNQPA